MKDLKEGESKGYPCVDNIFRDQIRVAYLLFAAELEHRDFHTDTYMCINKCINNIEK